MDVSQDTATQAQQANVGHPGYQVYGYNRDRLISEDVKTMLIATANFQKVGYVGDDDVLRIGHDTPLFNDVPWNITKAEALHLVDHHLSVIQRVLNSTLSFPARQDWWDACCVLAYGRHASDWVCDPIYQSLMWQGPPLFEARLRSSALQETFIGHYRPERVIYAAGLLEPGRYIKLKRKTNEPSA